MKPGNISSRIREVAVAVALLVAFWALGTGHPSSQTQVANNAANLQGKTLLAAENSNTVTGLLTFGRSPNPPFAVNSGSAKVSNLDADTVDGLDSTRFTWNPVTTTSTGTQNDFAPGLSGNTILYCNNASLLTITGFAGGYAGQHVRVISIGGGQVDLPHQNTGSTTAADRLINFTTSGATSLAANAGHAEYVYDGTTQRWRLVTHTQGDYIEYGGTSTITGWSSRGTTFIRYYLVGRDCRVIFDLEGTSNAVTITFTLPFTSPTTGQQYTGTEQVTDNGTIQAALGLVRWNINTAQVAAFKDATGLGWTASGTKNVIGQVYAQVQ